MRERAMFVDIESLPSEAMIQLAITASTLTTPLQQTR
jgi:hypothetical protein